MLLEQHHWRHAAALLVARVLEDGDFTDLAVRHPNQGECRAVAEMLGNLGVQAAGLIRRYRNQHKNLLS